MKPNTYLDQKPHQEKCAEGRRNRSSARSANAQMVTPVALLQQSLEIPENANRSEAE